MLADVGQNKIRRYFKFGSFHWNRATSAGCIGGAQLVFDAHDAVGGVIGTRYLYGGYQEMNMDTFLDGIFDFIRVRGHLFPGTTIEYIHLACP